MTWWRCVQLLVGLCPLRSWSLAVRRLLAFFAVRGRFCISSMSAGFAIMPQRLPVTIHKKLVTVAIQRNCCTFSSFSKKEKKIIRALSHCNHQACWLSVLFRIAALDSERRDILSFRTLVISIHLSSVSCSSLFYLLCKAFCYPAEWVLSERNALHRLHRPYHFLWFTAPVRVL